MGIYELDDDLVRDWVNGRSIATMQAVFDQVSAQLPLPVPTRLGAVVRCNVQLTAEETTLFVRYSSDPHEVHPWVQAGTTVEAYSDAEIGRIVKVESEGVTLEPPYHETDD